MTSQRHRCAIILRKSGGNFLGGIGHGEAKEPGTGTTVARHTLGCLSGLRGIETRFRAMHSTGFLGFPAMNFMI